MAGPSQSSAVSAGASLEVMGDDVQTWSQHLPFKHKASHKGLPLPFLEPGLASLETECPPVLSEMVVLGGSGEREQYSPWGLHCSQSLTYVRQSLPDSIKRNTTQGRMRWLQAVHSLLGEWLPAPVGSAK